ncbi:unnamed protein product [Prunus armeniaca]
MEGMSELPLTSIAMEVSNAVLVTSDRTDFILSKRTFGRMVQTTDAAVSLLSLGIVDIEYRREKEAVNKKKGIFPIEYSRGKICSHTPVLKIIAASLLALNMS